MHRFFVLAPLALLASPAFADALIFNLDQSVLTTPPGGIFYPTGPCQNQNGDVYNCAIFTGTISSAADPANDYFLNALYVTMSPSNPDGGADVFDNTYDNQFYGNAYFLAATYLAGASLLGPDNPSGSDVYSGGIFEVDLQNNPPPGNYFGTATLAYTNETDCTDPSNPCTVSQNFDLDVIPEPSMFALAAAGVVFLMAKHRWEKSRRL